MPVYTAEPSGAERAAAAVLLEQAANGATAADVLEGISPSSAGLAGPRAAHAQRRVSASRPDGRSRSSRAQSFPRGSPFPVVPQEYRCPIPLFPRRPPATDDRSRVRQPLVFGGIPEAEGWVLAPITPRDRVHFRVDHELPLEEFRAELPGRRHGQLRPG